MLSFQILGFTVIEILEKCLFNLNRDVNVLVQPWEIQYCLCGPAGISKWESTEEWPITADTKSNYDFNLNQGRLYIQYYYLNKQSHYEISITKFTIPRPRSFFPLKKRWFKKVKNDLVQWYPRFGFWPK